MGTRIEFQDQDKKLGKQEFNTYLEAYLFCKDFNSLPPTTDRHLVATILPGTSIFTDKDTAL